MSGPFTYFNNIPQATDIIAQSQPQLLSNFGSIMSIIDVNHGDFATAVAGQHKYVQMPVQASPPALLAGEVGLYNFPVSGINQMFVRKSDTTSVPMTQASLARPGYTYLPSGIILQWGQVSANTNPFGPITFPIAFPNAVLTVNCSMVTPSSTADPNTFVYVVVTPDAKAPTTTQFWVSLYKRDSHQSVPVTNPGQFFYLAIGY